MNPYKRASLGAWIGLTLLLAVICLLPACAPAPHAHEAHETHEAGWHWRNRGLPPQLSVTSVLALPRAGDGDLLLAGVYSPQSLYVSEDGGKRWRLADAGVGRPTGVDGQPVHALHLTGDHRALAGTSTGLYASQGLNAGGALVWERVSHWPQGWAVYALARMPEGASLVAGAWPALLILDREEARFTQPVVSAPGGLLSGLALADGTLLAGADGAGLFVSRDGGDSWQQAGAIGETYVAGLLSPAWDDALVLARTRRGLFRSADGGQGWSPIELAAPGRPDALHALGDQRTLLVGMSTGQILASRDDGASWQPWGAGLPRDGLFQTLTHTESGGEIRLWAGNGHALYASDDNGQSWQPHPDLGAPMLASLALAEDGALYAGSHDGVYRSEDGGRRWEWAGDGLPARTVAALHADPHQAGRIYAGVDGDGLWRKEPGADLWQRVGWANTPVLGALADWADPGRIFVRIGFERIYEGERPAGQGAAQAYGWMARWEGMATTTEVLSFAQSGMDPDLLFAGGATDLYRSRDRGQRWQAVARELAGQSVYFLKIEPGEIGSEETVLAGATNGLYRSRDGGESWQPWGAGLEDKTVTGVARHPREAGLLFAGTRYAGIYRSQDGGASWQPDFVPDPFAPPLRVAALAFSPDGDELYAATDQGFLVKSGITPPLPEDAGQAAIPTPTPSPAPATAASPVSPRYGMHTVSASPEMVPLVHEAGFDTVVALFTWWDVEPTQGQFVWQPWDEMVAAADYYGLNLVIRLDKTPDWARPDPLSPDAPPVKLADYARFVETVAARYRGRVAGYIIWNEPNLALEWAGLPPNPQAYVSLLGTGYGAVKRGDPDALVLSAGLAPTNTDNAEAMDDRRFLAEMYRYGAGDFFDVMAAHPYGFGRPPGDPRGANNGLNMARLADLRAIMEANGDGEKRVWITEMGWILPGYTQSPGQSVTPDQQARYWADALEIIRGEWPWVALITAWNLGGQEHPDWGGYSLLDRDGRPRPAYRALQAAVIAQTGPPVLPRRAQPNRVTILAPDAVVHLGDAPHLGQPWYPIYRAMPISPVWDGVFYLDDPGQADWRLTLRVMQSNFWSNQIWINGAPLPQAIPLEDFSRSWVAYTVPVPAHLLQVGANQIQITIAQSLPLIQAANFAYDELQIKDITLLQQGQIYRGDTEEAE